MHAGIPVGAAKIEWSRRLTELGITPADTL